MRRTRTAMTAVAAAVVLLATACYPPSQTPTNQPIPPGGRVVATAAALKYMWIEDASDDLSTILYGQHDFVLSLDPLPNRFWVYDDDTGTTTQVPVGRAESATARLSPDARSVVFSSNDASLQVGPVAVNCTFNLGPFTPDRSTMCDELYLFDVDTGDLRQLTGLDGSSDRDNAMPTFSEDGQSIEFAVFGPGRVVEYRRLDLATGLVEDDVPTPAPTSWDRGSHVVSWNESTGTLTSADTTSGDVTTLFADPAVFYLRSVIDDGRFIVLSLWETDRLEVFRLIDTETGSVRVVSSPWISEDGSQYAVVQQNVTPDATDRLIIAPLPN